MDNLYSYCNVVGNTDVGCKRAANEDWLTHFECSNGLVSVVCDGMGGHVGGAVASHLAVDTIKSFLETRFFDDPREAIVEACNAANAAILERTARQPELTGMGSTCVMLIVRNGKVYIGSVGDSRIYLIRSKHITQLTKDQSYVQMLVDAGQITKEQAENHPRKNEITNALGLPSMSPATVLPDAISPEAGDCFLLCSDGLSGMVSDHDILKVASNQTGLTQRQRVDELIQRARRNGGLDNITCMIVEFSVTPDAVSGGKKRRNLLLTAIAALIVVAVACFFLINRCSKDDVDEVRKLSDAYVSQGFTRIPCNDTVAYSPSAEVVVIELIPRMGLRIIVADKSGTYDTLNVNDSHITSEGISIRPDSCFVSTAMNDNRITLQFNDKPFKDSQICVEIKTADSSFFSIIPVVNTASSNMSKEAIATAKAVNDDGEKKSGEKGEKTELYNATKERVEHTITINGKTKQSVVRLYSADEISNDSAVYTNHAIKPTNGNVDKGWYVFSSNGRECVITIDYNKTPAKKALIEIPLKSIDSESLSFKLHVHKAQ